MGFSFGNQNKWFIILSCATCISSPFQFTNIQQSGICLPVMGFIKIKPDKNKNKSFKNLRCTEQDKENITYIITCMGEKGKFWLLGNKGDLDRRGDEILDVHPLKFLSVVFQDEYLKKVCVPEILNDYFKRSNFISRLGANMTKEAQKGTLQKYLKDFMKEVHLDSSHFNALMEFVEERDWRGFVSYLSQN